MLYTLISDYHNYLEFHFDRDQIYKMLAVYGDDDICHRVDVNGEPKSFQYIVKEPLNLSFPIVDKPDKNKKIPDIDVNLGRLFLSDKAYKLLKPLIESDGDFLPVTYENGSGYFYIPLRVAEIDPTITKRDEWEEIVSLGFDDEQVKNWSLFRTEYNGYTGLYCQESIKEAIEGAQLTGLFITNDLANIFPEERSSVAQLN